VTRWSGSAWFALGSNAGANNALNGIVYAIAVSGTDVYVGGDFTNAAGIPEADYLARWDGSAWSALGSDGSGDGALKSDVFALALSGGDLYVGGKFIDADGIPEADYLAEWDGANWSAVSPSGGALNSYVLALAVSGPDLYVGGAFTNAGGMTTTPPARCAPRGWRRWPPIWRNFTASDANS